MLISLKFTYNEIEFVFKFLRGIEYLKLNFSVFPLEDKMKMSLTMSIFKIFKKINNSLLNKPINYKKRYKVDIPYHEAFELIYLLDNKLLDFTNEYEKNIARMIISQIDSNK